MTAQKFSVIFRYLLIVIAILFFCVAILGRAGKTIFIERSHWQRKADSLRIEDVIILPTRGNILAEDGRLMASSVPRYYLSIDFRADGFKLDTLQKYVGPLSAALSKKLKDRSPEGYRAHLMRGYDSKDRDFLISNQKVSYIDLKEIKKFPFLRLSVGRSGFKQRMQVMRQKPFGSLASRTIGDIYGEYEKGGKNGLELQYDSLLRGTPGLSTKQRMRGRWVTTPQVEPVNGLDVKSTINIEMQDITEKALTDKLVEIDAQSGTAVVMEVSTGEIKAITNIERVAPGAYAETKNLAVSDLSEPGSTFKVASMMVALDAGVVDPKDSVDTGSGVYMYARARMTDHNWNKGGYGRITAEQAIWNSSNIGVAKIILKGFEKNPEDYVKRIRDIGWTADLELEIPGAGRARIRAPKDPGWSKTSLPWMSFGYETQIPPIYTLTFYNAIANDGKMIRPVFVKEICKNGETIERKHTKTVNSSICSRSTLKIIREMLRGVITDGTGKVVNSPYVEIAGKTGTAQLSTGKAGYAGGGHQVSFCGYFPAGDPRYSCIVVIRNPRIGYASGGTMSGGVFRTIAEQIYARSLVRDVTEELADTLHSPVPRVLNGEYDQTKLVLNNLDVDYSNQRDTAHWVKTDVEENEVLIKDMELADDLVPRVIGMGVKDALYLLEKRGLKTQVYGSGRITQQSVTPGSRVSKGQTVVLTLK